MSPVPFLNRMWLLILPPLIFLVSLWLLLLFLSRRTVDPAVQERLRQEAVAPAYHFFFFKEETGLHMLEKLNQRFKVFFLKLHNASSAWSQALRARRERFRKKDAPLSGEVSLTPVSTPRRRSWWLRFRRETDAGVAHGERPIMTETPVSLETPGASISDVATAASLPTEKASIPLLRRRRDRDERPKRLVSEEDLISKIAKNPKDAVAYEELGDYYMETKQLEDAKACYRQVIKLSPMNRAVKEKVRKLERLLTRAER